MFMLLHLKKGSDSMRLFFVITFFLAGFIPALVSGAKMELPDETTLRSWVQEMKKSQRGPFKQIRWFCNDGSILPPKAYACREHGGGVQHGEWTDRVKLMRDNGYYIANVYADIDSETFQEDSRHPQILKQMILERFLINADDGWILRKARYYRGALQAEDETRGGRDLLIGLVEDPDWRQRRFIVLREAVRFLPHGRKGAPISEMRQLSLFLAEKDKNFETLRVKIHVQPELSDAADVREYAEKQGVSELSSKYERLAKIIEDVYKPRELGPVVAALAKQTKNSDLKRQLNQAKKQLQDQTAPEERFSAACRLMATLRDGLPKAGRAGNKLAFMDTSLLLEGELFSSSNELLKNLPGASLRQRLQWLSSSTEALYGTGFISLRQRQALQESFTTLLKTNPNLIDYQAELEYAARIPEWADRSLRFHFLESVAHLEEIEPLTRRYFHDRLRGSLLLLYSGVLEGLMSDAGRQLGIYNDLFGQKVASGLRGLNAGLARGVLKVPDADDDPHNFDPNSIYVLPATTEDLPPVAGIVTAGKGNILSHVQLLARNLGIPNVAADKRILPQILSKKGKKVVLAVSSRGIVQLVEDSARWDEIFDEQAKVQDILIRPDLNKLDLLDHSFIPLQDLRAADSGRVAGPKAANLGELKHHFPQAVTDGLVIPFGLYRALLDQPLEPGGPSVFSYMQQQYAMIRSIKGNPQRQGQVTRQFLQRMRDWIINADPGEDFRDRLRKAMAEVFGPDGTYGVFVRSDTNVEDLEGFTGAGLNLTVVNVVGFDHVLEAVSQVWASPFSERAYRWRQAYMENPEHIYASVLLLKSVPSDKSGVMVTVDVDSGQAGWLTIAVNEGVGGAVAGQTAEELRINTTNGHVRLMAHATEPDKGVILEEGGMTKIAASGSEAVLNQSEIQRLIEFARSVPDRFPMLKDTGGRPVPADIEFGFYKSKLVLFQIRPFLESTRARQNLYLNSLDQSLQEKHIITVDLDKIPVGEN
jgi:hypothetical protein